MKIITVTYPRYLDNVRLGARNYHFACADGVERGDTAIVKTHAGRVCATVEAVRDYDRPIEPFDAQHYPIARFLANPVDLFDYDMSAMHESASTP